MTLKIHGLSCKLGNGKQARHSTLNDLIARALYMLTFHASRNHLAYLGKMESAQMASLIPWRTGQSVVGT